MVALAFEESVPDFLHREAAQGESDRTRYIPETIENTHDSYRNIEATVSLEDTIIEAKEAESTHSGGKRSKGFGEP